MENQSKKADPVYDTGRKMTLAGRTFELWVHEHLEDVQPAAAGEYIHTHLRYEVHLAGEQGMQLRIENQTVDVSPGALLIVAPGVYNCFLPGGDGRRCLSYYCSGGAGEKTALEFTAPYLSCRQEADLGRYLACIEAERARSAAFSEEMEGHLFFCLLVALLRSVEKDKPAEKQIQRARSQDVIEMMERYLQIKHNNEPSKGELAAMLHVSERQLERIFDDVYGMSFREKVQKIRFETARYLRENLHYSAQRIAEIVGYSSVQAYYKAYKAYFNQHPED